MSRTRRLLLGLHASAWGNAYAFGYSIAITSSYGVVSIRHPQATTWEVLGFAIAGVVQVSIVDLLVALLVRNLGDAPESQRVVLIATATDLLTVAGVCGSLPRCSPHCRCRSCSRSSSRPQR